MLRLPAWELKTFFGQCRFLSQKEAIFNALILVSHLVSFLIINDSFDNEEIKLRENSTPEVYF